MKNSLLKKLIIILLSLDAIVGTAFGVYIYLSNDIAFFEKYYLIIFYAALFDVIAIVYLIVKLITNICKSRKAKKIAIAEEKARLEEERLKEIERQKAIEAENKRITQVKDEIESIIYRYKTQELPKPPVINNTKVYVDIENVQAVQMVKQYKVDQTNDIKKCQDINARINKILNTKLDPDEKLKHLKSNFGVLNSLKADSSDLHLKINTRKISVATESREKAAIGVLLGSIGNSEKCVSSKVDVDKLITTKVPAEYELFDCLSKPTILKYENISYCVFDNIILVFDRNGVFLTAIKPSSLLINFSKHDCYVEVTNDQVEDNWFIGTDSRCLKKGETTYSWLYMRKDGKPDKRYVNNPCYSHRKDKYEYGMLSFKLFDTTFTYSFSSAAAVNHALELSYKYDPKKYDDAKLCKIIFKKNRT